MDFISRLDFLIDRSGVKKGQFLADCGFNRNQYARWKEGIRPKETSIRLIASYFHVSAAYLTGESDDAHALNEQEELNEYLEMLKTRPEVKMLFSLAKGATKEDVERAVAIIEALKKNG